MTNYNIYDRLTGDKISFGGQTVTVLEKLDAAHPGRRD